MLTNFMKIGMGRLLLVGLAMSLGCGPNKGIEKGKDNTLKVIETSGSHASPQVGGPTTKDKEKTALGGPGNKNGNKK